MHPNRLQNVFVLIDNYFVKYDPSSASHVNSALFVYDVELNQMCSLSRSSPATYPLVGQPLNH